MASEANERDLLELTSLPTAAGREGRVVAWVEAWAEARPWARVERDRFGNVVVRGAEGGAEGGEDTATEGDTPIVFAAHMDHPAFVVTAVRGGRTIEAAFRGGVADAYFVGTPVRLHRDGASVRGVVKELHPATPPELDKRVVIEWSEDADGGGVEIGDILTWDLPEAEVREGLVHAPACDDLAGVAAALGALDALNMPAEAGTPDLGRADVRVLLTRAEEVGFVGAMAACRSGAIPRGARIVALETSKSFADSPIGGGSIVRVGDRTSTFDPELTYRVGKVAEQLAAEDASFKWQRKLMTGGTCEASAYQALGYTATCVCLALGNYHNMNEATGRIDRESISLEDYHGLVRLLAAIGRTLDDPGAGGGPGAGTGLKSRLDGIFEQRRHLLDERA